MSGERITRGLGEDDRDLWIKTVLVIVGSDPQRRAFLGGYNGHDRPPQCSDRMRKNYRLGIAVRKAIMERERGEDTCEDCGNHNPIWHAPNDVWNLVMGGAAAEGDPGGFICPSCFLVRAAVAAPHLWRWRLAPVPEQDDPDGGYCGGAG